MTTGRGALRKAEWLFGFDFDSTLADPERGDQVDKLFFKTLDVIEQKVNFAWGICTGRSLEHIIEGLEKFSIPRWPHYLVTQERDIFYLDAVGGYQPDECYNTKAREALSFELSQNEDVIDLIREYVITQTKGQWISIEGEPAGVVAEDESQISHIVDLIEQFESKTSHLDYQRNSIYLRLTHQAYSKGSALQYIQRQYSLKPNKSVTVGDNLNDFSMLHANVARYFGVPKNGHKSLMKRVVDQGGIISTFNYAQGVSDILNRIGVV